MVTRVGNSASLACRALVAVGILASLDGSVPAFAQASPPLAFEVAAVRPNPSPTMARWDVWPGGFRAIASPLRRLVSFAHEIHEGLIVDAPGWVDSERFDIDAKPPGPSTREDLRAMLRVLLAERFRLRAHVEARDMSTYALVMADLNQRFGPGLHPVVVDCGTNRLEDVSGPGLFPSDSRPPCGTSLVNTSLRTGSVLRSVKFAAITTAQLASSLHGDLGRPVIDKTGLTGTFDVELEYVTEGFGELPLPTPTTLDRRPDGVPVITALEKQLGIRARSERNQVKVLVIDSVDRPTRN